VRAVRRLIETTPRVPEVAPCSEISSSISSRRAYVLASDASEATGQTPEGAEIRSGSTRLGQGAQATGSSEGSGRDAVGLQRDVLADADLSLGIVDRDDVRRRKHVGIAGLRQRGHDDTKSRDREADELLRVLDRRPSNTKRKARQVVLCDVDGRRSIETKKRKRTVGREVSRTSVKCESELRRALDAELHHDRLDEHLLARRIYSLDHVSQRGVVVERRGDDERVRRLVRRDRYGAFEERSTCSGCSSGIPSTTPLRWVGRRSCTRRTHERSESSRDVGRRTVLHVVHVNAPLAFERHVKLPDHFEDVQIGPLRGDDDQRVRAIVRNDVPDCCLRAPAEHRWGPRRFSLRCRPCGHFRCGLTWRRVDCEDL
jgi:hypothetical protein